MTKRWFWGLFLALWIAASVWSGKLVYDARNRAELARREAEMATATIWPSTPGAAEKKPDPKVCPEGTPLCVFTANGRPEFTVSGNGNPFWTVTCADGGYKGAFWEFPADDKAREFCSIAKERHNKANNAELKRKLSEPQPECPSLPELICI